MGRSALYRPERQPRDAFDRCRRTRLHLYGIRALPGGFCGHCAAWQYRRLAALARHRRVRLRVDKRKGLYFLLRPLLRRKGLWAGLVAWGLVLVWLQGLIWAVDYGSLTTGQRARAGAVLRSCGLQPGTAVTEELLRTGEYALLESGEFSWASLNFEKGRLAVEAAPAHARPEIAAGTLHGLRAKCNGTVLRTNLASGTMLVVPGQAVEAGQGLIGTARSERDGTLIFAPAAGTVVAQLEWETNQSIPLAETLPQLTGENKTNYRLFFAGNSAALSPSAPDGDGLYRTRHLQLEVFGLPLPCAMEETTYYGQQQETLYRTEAQALTLARLQGLRALHDAFPDAEILARREACTMQEETLHYNAVYTVAADICT